MREAISYLHSIYEANGVDAIMPEQTLSSDCAFTQQSGSSAFVVLFSVAYPDELFDPLFAKRDWYAMPVGCCSRGPCSLIMGAESRRYARSSGPDPQAADPQRLLPRRERGRNRFCFLVQHVEGLPPETAGNCRERKRNEIRVKCLDLRSLVKRGRTKQRFIPFILSDVPHQSKVLLAFTDAKDTRRYLPFSFGRSGSLLLRLPQLIFHSRDISSVAERRERLPLAFAS